MEKLYGLTADDVAKIKQLLARVEAIERSPAPHQAVDYPGGYPVTFYVGTQSGAAWAKNATSEVSTWGGILVAKNYFADIPVSPGSRNCAIIWTGIEWVLIGLEC
jgi:hypothetical protein